MSESTRGKVSKTDEQWRSQLTPEQYGVTRKARTERAFSHAYTDEKGSGVYRCVCCGEPLFEAKAKYDSGTGWPSFWEPVETRAVSELDDSSLFRRRTEVRCSHCDSHLGHLFPDGPKPTGLRYCINGLALDLAPARHAKADNSGKPPEAV